MDRLAVGNPQQQLRRVFYCLVILLGLLAFVERAQGTVTVTLVGTWQSYNDNGGDTQFVNDVVAIINDGITTVDSVLITSVENATLGYYIIVAFEFEVSDITEEVSREQDFLSKVAPSYVQKMVGLNIFSAVADAEVPWNDDDDEQTRLALGLGIGLPIFLVLLGLVMVGIFVFSFWIKNTEEI